MPVATPKNSPGAENEAYYSKVSFQLEFSYRKPNLRPKVNYLYPRFIICWMALTAIILRQQSWLRKIELVFLQSTSPGPEELVITTGPRARSRQRGAGGQQPGELPAVSRELTQSGAHAALTKRGWAGHWAICSDSHCSLGTGRERNSTKSKLPPNTAFEKVTFPKAAGGTTPKTPTLSISKLIATKSSFSD